MFRRHPLLSVFTLAYLGVVGWVTLGPQPFDTGDDGIAGILLRIAWRAGLDWVTYAGLEFAANVLMFFPIGLFFLLLLGRRRWWGAILLGFLLTAAIETAQIFIPGRVPDLRDIVSNTSGAVAGVLVGLLLTAAGARRERRRRPSVSTALRPAAAGTVRR